MFLEFYRFEALEETVGHALTLRQGNTSVSAKGVGRGIHYALVPPGQAKYVTVPSGSVIDYVIDLRVGSPTFGRWDSVLLDDVDRRAVYLEEGLGHAFVSLTEGAVVSYLVSEVFSAERELSISLLDPAVALDLPGELLLSDRDRAAPSLSEALDGGLLPTWHDTRDLYRARAEG